MKNSIFISLLFLLLASSNVSYSQSEKKYIRKGKRAVQKLKFDEAIGFYNSALQLNPENGKARLGLGRLYLYDTKQYDSALVQLNQPSVEVLAEKDAFIYYDIANAYRFNEKPKLALAYFDKLEKNENISSPTFHDNLRIDLAVKKEYCENALKMSPKQNDILKAENLGMTFNSVNSEYTSVYIESEDLLIYNGRYRDFERERRFGDNDFMENIYYHNLSEDVVSTYDRSNMQDNHLAVVAKIRDTDSILVYYENKVWISKLKFGSLSGVQPLPIDIKDFEHLPHGAFSENQDYFIFSGKKSFEDNLDLYQTRLSNGEWSLPEKVISLNTNLDEDSPFLVNGDSILYFSSKGHHSMGEYDIFKSVLSKQGNWSEPIQLPKPYNSSADDIYFELIPGGELGYLSSDRIGGFGSMDLYKLILAPTPTFDCIPYESGPIIAQLNIPADMINENLSYHWNFDDGEIIEGESVSKTYEFPGEHYATIQIHNKDKNSVDTSFFTKKFKIDSPEFVGFSYPYYAYKDSQLILNANVSHLSGYNVDKIYWKINDQVIDAPTPILDYTFKDTGIYFVTAQIFFIDESGFYESFCYSQSLNITIPDTKKNKDDLFTDNSLYSNKNDSDVVTETKVDTAEQNEKINNNANIDFGNILFGFDSYSLTPASKSSLDKIINYMKANPNFKLKLAGYTDAIGNKAYNLRLSKKRVSAAKIYLVKHGISESRVSETQALGESNPIAPNSLPNGKDNPQGRKLNRRVEYVFS